MDVAGKEEWLTAIIPFDGNMGKLSIVIL